jgi:amino acid adenylation domain-containing protein
MAISRKSSLHLSATKQALLDRLRDGTRSDSAHIPKASGSEIASSAQRQLWLLEQAFEDGPYPYNQSVSLNLDGPLDSAALEASLNEIIRRHRVLRTGFERRDGNVVTHIEHERTVRLRLVEFPGIAGHMERKDALEALAREETRERFDLARGSVVRAQLVRFSQARHALLLTFHHIAVDGLSLRTVVEELAALYDAFVNRLPSPLQELRTQYSDFAAWQHSRLQGDFLASEIDFWKRELSGELPLLDLPLDRDRLAVRRFCGAREEICLTSHTINGIKEIGSRHSATVFMTMLAAYHVLLHCYSGQNVVVVGSPTAGRVHGDVADLIGCFINQLTHRTTIDARTSFSGLLRQVSDTAKRISAHQELPFEMIVTALAIPRTKHQNPIFQTLFGLQETPPCLSAGGLIFDGVIIHNGGTAKFDLELNIYQDSSDLAVCCDYDTDVFDKQTAARMLRHYVRILEQAARDPETLISRIQLLDDEERQQILVKWNATDTESSTDRCVHQLLEEQATRTPDRVALVFEGMHLTYRQLNERSNQLAHYLKRMGVSREVIVGLCLERSLEMIVALLGVLKAGGACLPIDWTLPPERLAFIMDETRPLVVLSQERLAELFTRHGPMQMICLDRHWTAIAKESSKSLAGCSRPDDLMYVMFTSGSSGQPKGVMLEHRGVTNRVVAMRRAYFSERDIVLQKTPFTFDVAIGETFCPLLAGARLIIARPDGHRDVTYLKEVIQEQGVTVTEFVPSMLQVFVKEPGVANACDSLRLVIASGEALSRELQDRYFAQFIGEMHNLYGPTETGEVTSWPCERGTPLATAGVPIGRPMANCQIYILDAHGRPLPVGARGEVFIGGIGLARGYLGRPDLTAERFLPNPFAECGARIYATGDIARYRADGIIEYLGRADHQVKIRGYRVELGEIESVLRRMPGIRDAVVLTREDRPGDQRLVAYVAASVQEAFSTEDLRSALRKHLPEIMVPSTFVVLNELPLTANGKLDREALPPAALATSDRAGELPQNETERKLVGIWSAVLGIETIGVCEDFFELGGHSLLVVQVVSRIRQEFGIEIPQQEVFEGPTVRELAAKIDEVQTKSQELLGGIPKTEKTVQQARAILADPFASPTAKLGAKRFLEALSRE